MFFAQILNILLNFSVLEIVYYSLKTLVHSAVTAKKTKQMIGTIRNGPVNEHDVAHTFSNLHQEYFR